MTTPLLCLNAAGATDRLTQGAYYRVVKELGAYIVVIDDWGEATMFWATRFERVSLGTRKEVRVRG